MREKENSEHTIKLSGTSLTKKTIKFCPNYTVAASTSRKPPMITVYISSQQKEQQHNIKQEDFLIEIMDREKGVVEEGEEDRRMQDTKVEGSTGTRV